MATAYSSISTPREAADGSPRSGLLRTSLSGAWVDRDSSGALQHLLTEISVAPYTHMQLPSPSSGHRSVSFDFHLALLILATSGHPFWLPRLAR